MVTGMDHPREERIYQLKELAVPPKRYSYFLAKAVQAVEQLIVEEHNCSSLEEVAKKYLHRMRKLNPERPVNELVEAPLSLAVRGKLLYDRGHKRRRSAGRIYRSTEYEESLSDAYNPGKWIELSLYKEELATFVEAVDATLNQKFSRREGKVLDDLFRRPKSAKEGESDALEKHLRGFRFVVSMQSFPTAMLEVEIRLRNYGSMLDMGRKQAQAIPAIHVQAQQLYADSLSFPRKVVEAVGEVAEKYYTITHIEQRSRFTRKVN